MGKYKYKIADTTHTQRKDYALDGDLSRLGGGQPSKFARDLMNEYVNGNVELAAAKEAVLAKYKQV